MSATRKERLTISIFKDRCPRELAYFATYLPAMAQIGHPARKWPVTRIEARTTFHADSHGLTPLGFRKVVRMNPSICSLESTSHPGKRNKYMPGR